MLYIKGLFCFVYVVLMFGNFYSLHVHPRNEILDMFPVFDNIMLCPFVKACFVSADLTLQLSQQYRSCSLILISILYPYVNSTTFTRNPTNAGMCT